MQRALHSSKAVRYASADSPTAGLRHASEAAAAPGAKPSSPRVATSFSRSLAGVIRVSAHVRVRDRLARSSPVFCDLALRGVHFGIAELISWTVGVTGRGEQALTPEEHVGGRRGLDPATHQCREPELFAVAVIVALDPRSVRRRALGRRHAFTPTRHRAAHASARNRTGGRAAVNHAPVGRRVRRRRILGRRGLPERAAAGQRHGEDQRPDRHTGGGSEGDEARSTRVISHESPPSKGARHSRPSHGRAPP